MGDPLPIFKYQPDAVKNRAIVRKDGVCALCGKARDYFCSARYRRYDDPERNVLEICPWCLADGSVEEKAGCDFSSECRFDGDIDEKEALEVLFRTPGFSGLQETKWLTHCGSACAYLGTVDKAYLIENGIDVRDDLEREGRSRRHSASIVLSMLEDNHIYQGYLFRCLKCGAYRLEVDCD